MKSFTGKIASGRGWVLLLALLLGAGMMISACGEEEVPAPTTPAPPPPAPPPTPEPEPTPEPPATPTGLMVSGATESSITWTWTAVEGAAGYVVQASTDEMFDDTVLGNAETVLFDGVPLTTETSYTATGLEAETSLYVRVAAAAGTPDAPVVSNFSTHVTGMTTPVALAPAPANLRVKNRGSDFIEWEWDAVEGVDGYQSQFSANTGFSNPNSELHQAVDLTSRRVSNLDSETTGYLRVRTYTGALTAPTFGMWTEGSMSSTTEAVAVPLAAPTGLESDASNASVTLQWERVRNAGSYEVEQREPGNDWEDADCGDGSNEVEDTECVAIGLTAGTDYDFQVRAVPSDTDRYLTSDWSETEPTRTEGTAPGVTTPPTSGGMGALNVEWESNGTSITFLWERVPDGEYQTAVLETYSDDPEPCDDATFVNQRRSTSQVVPNIAATETDPMVRGLCVQTMDEDNRRLSFAWGIPTPFAPTAETATTDKGKTTSLPWTGINVAKDFNYVVRLVADTGRENGMFSSTTATTDAALQKACADGMRLDDGLADVTLTGLTETVDSGIRHFTGYTLCLQYWNDKGMTDWAVPNDGSAPPNLIEIQTTPGTPPTPRFDRGTNNADGTERTLAWTVAVRNSTDVPREHGGFEANIIHYPLRRDHDSDPATSLQPTPVPTVKACGGDATDDSDNTWTRLSSPTLATSLDGITVTTAAPIAIPESTEENLGVRLCVRAKRSSAGGSTDVFGPWSFGGNTTITKQAPPF